MVLEFKIMLPLGIAVLLAGLIIGFSPVTLDSSANVGCGSGLDSNYPGAN